MSEPLVYVIVLNWNGMDHLHACLESLKNQSYSNYRILIVDNNSTDGSQDYVRSNYPEVEILQNRKNLGFAKGNNLGIFHSMARGAEYLVILNNDTECDRHFISELVKIADSDTSIGACAPKIMFFDARSIINGIGTEASLLGYGWDRGIGEKDDGQYDSAEEIFGISGGACLIKREVIDRVGAFDPTYSFYFEDIDLSWRMRLAGCRIMAAPGSVVYHKFSASWGKSSPSKDFLFQKNRIRNVLKNFSAKSLLNVLPRMALYDLKIIRYLIEKHDAGSLKRCLIFLKAYLWNILHLPGLLTARRKIKKCRALSDEEMLRFLTPIYGPSFRISPDYKIHDIELYEKTALKPTHIIMGKNDGFSLGAGWANLHTPEGTNKISRRTSLNSCFYLPRDDTTGRFLEIDFQGCRATALKGEVLANSVKVGDYSVGKDEEKVLSFPLPLEMPGSDVWECRIITGEGWRPDDYFRDGDYRTLGVSVTGIKLISYK